MVAAAQDDTMRFATVIAWRRGGMDDGDASSAIARGGVIAVASAAGIEC